MAEVSDLDLMVLALQAAGLSTVAAGDGRSALRLLVSASPAVVVVDLMLPVTSAFDVIRECAKAGAAPVVFTATDEGERRRHAFYAGAVAFHRKGGGVREVVLTVRALLGADGGDGGSSRTTSASTRVVG